MSTERPEAQNQVVVTMPVMYDTLLEVRDAVLGMSGQSDQLKDHEERLRKVERNIWIIVGIGLVLQFLNPLLLTLFAK